MMLPIDDGKTLEILQVMSEKESGISARESSDDPLGNTPPWSHFWRYLLLCRRGLEHISWSAIAVWPYPLLRERLQWLDIRIPHPPIRRCVHARGRRINNWVTNTSLGEHGVTNTNLGGPNRCDTIILLLGDRFVGILCSFSKILDTEVVSQGPESRNTA